MKANQNFFGRLILGCIFACCLTSFKFEAFAIEGIAVSIQSSNVVLSWPSAEPEIYVVQFRPALTSTNGWQTLTSSLPAPTDTNVIFFVHTNAAEYGYATTVTNSTGGGSGPTPPGGGSSGATNGIGTVFIPGTGFYQVARLGVHIVGMENFTNGAVLNTIEIPFEVANETGTLKTVSILVDGARYRGATPVVAPGISGKIAMDTSFLENGDHAVQVTASWLNPDSMDVNNFNFMRYSDSFTLTVSNIISFPNWTDEIGELGFAHYSFQTTCTNSMWEIDIYDVSNRLAKILSGNTGDGFVETNWDLIDTNGLARATNDADGVFSSVITVGDPTTKNSPNKYKSLSYPGQGQWVIAYQDSFGNMANSNDLRSAIYTFGSLGAANGGAVTVFPTSGHPENGQVFPMRYPYPFIDTPPTQAQVEADENALLKLLTNRVNRNFYYNGHGTVSSIATVSASQIYNVIGTNHFYRFVFLDCCSAAHGSLPAVFGINFGSEQSFEFFQTNGLRPRTFIGYDKEVSFATTGGSYLDSSNGQTYSYKVADRVIDFLNNLEFYWYFNYDLTTSIYNAENNTPDLRSGWADGPDLKLFGYPRLHIDEFNQQADWSN